MVLLLSFLYGLLSELLSVLLALLGKGSLLLWSMSPSDTYLVIVSVENSIELSHENVSDKEHFFLDVHFHNCWGAHGLWWTGWRLSVGGKLSRFEFDLLAIDFGLSIDDILWFNLSEDLWTKGSHLEFHLGATLSKAKLLWIEHPFFWSKIVIFTTDNESEITKLIFVITFNKSVSSWNFLFSHLVESISWHRHQGSSGVKSNQTTLWPSLANIEWFSVDFNVIESDTEHVLEKNIVPVNVTIKLGLIVISKSKIRFHSIFMFVLKSGQVEWENIRLQKMLLDHFIKNWSNSSFSEGWISKTNNGFEIRASENSMLLLDITELLIFDVDLSTRLRTFAWPKSDIISDEMTSKISRSEEDLSFLGSIGCGGRSQVIVCSLFRGTSKINGMTKNPSVGGSSIKKSSDELWGVSYVHIRNISVILKVILNNMGLDFFSWLIDWAVSNLVNSLLSLGVGSDWRWGAAFQLNI